MSSFRRKNYCVTAYRCDIYRGAKFLDGSGDLVKAIYDRNHANGSQKISFIVA